MAVVEKDLREEDCGSLKKYGSLINLLGGKNLIGMSISSGFDIISLGQRGISKASLEALIEHVGISKKGFIEKILDLSVKTIERKKDEDKLDRRTSSHVIEIAKVVDHALSVFEDEKKVQRWLTTPNRALNNNQPIDLFFMPTGLSMVDQVLGRIEEGVFS